jgi:diphthamide biosynthesis protein 4
MQHKLSNSISADPWAQFIGCVVLGEHVSVFSLICDTISGVHSMSETHYDVLKLPCTCSADDVKKAYKRLLLTEHPDKLSQRGASDTAEQRPVHAVRMHKVQEAYHVLRDSERRSRYDAHLQDLERRTHLLLWDSISVKEMHYDADISSHCFRCRCGDIFELRSADLLAHQRENKAACSVLTECHSCANVLEVLVDTPLTEKPQSS